MEDNSIRTTEILNQLCDGYDILFITKNHNQMISIHIFKKIINLHVFWNMTVSFHDGMYIVKIFL